MATALDLIDGRLDDALRMEAINGYLSIGDSSRAFRYARAPGAPFLPTFKGRNVMSEERNPVVNLDALDLVTQENGERFEAAMAQIGPRTGARKLGARLCVVPPGKAAWPYHAHVVNEEMIVVLAGKGTLRLGDRERPLRAGDVVALLPGGVESAHQIVNCSTGPLRYLCVSTMEQPDIGIYPDSGKFFVLAGSPPGGDKDKRSFSHIGRMADAVGYWDGEG
ncbi:conserved hypothetical protein [Candidatus Accumulibacter aalborgensis]|uniref:Cupin type-2 domain-containing protein n=1 Tax=Candidatus Accumulibacter aalborgensis TaxID=1860102 RepID=A0A1A8XYB4_9PROT|nr:conserved hypothetical protein [Candidatus Accumulibacter aalborgensis]